MSSVTSSLSLNELFHLFIISQVFNSDKELAFGEKYPHVRIFMAALKQSPIEIEDLIGVEIPWAVPSNSM